MTRGSRRRGEGRSPLRGLARVAAMLVAMLVLLPVSFGPAWAPVARTLALGGPSAHACACGMRPGTCGCPECERELFGAGRLPDARDVLGNCDDHGPRGLGAGLPPCVLPAAAVVAAAAMTAPCVAPLAVSDPASVSPPPPTPPPRLDLV